MLLLSPALLVLTALVIVPLLATIAFSFFDLRLGESSAKFIGLQNYGDLGIGRAVPISRLNLDEYNLLTVHS
ncbi:hypothetical protein L571_3107 [Bordetella pertussis 2371640]|nr:hypothetical protein L571_3107 [Bordetella pertussis 2371640]